MNRPLQPLWITGVLLCRGDIPGTSPERAMPYRWPAVEVTLTLFSLRSGETRDGLYQTIFVEVPNFRKVLGRFFIAKPLSECSERGISGAGKNRTENNRR